MTICRKCGKQIPDGQELCSDCQKKTSSSGENYLDGLMQNMDTEKGSGPAASDELNADAISALLDILSVDNSEVNTEEEENPISRNPEDEAEVVSEGIRLIEPSLFLDNEEGGLFADGSGAEELEGLEVSSEETAVEEVPLPEPEELAQEEAPEEMPELEEPVLEEMPELEASVLEETPEEMPEPEAPVLEEMPESEEIVLEEPLPEPEEIEDSSEPEPDLVLEEAPLPEDMEESQDAENQDLEELPDLSVPEEPERAEADDAAEDELSDILSKLDSAEEQPPSSDEIDMDTVLSGELAMDTLALEESDMGDMALDEGFASGDAVTDVLDELTGNTATEAMFDESASVDTVFQDALSAVDYSEKEVEELAEDDVPSPFALDEMRDAVLEGVESVPAAEPVKKKKKKREKKQKEPKEPKKPKEAGFFQRIFSNIVTEEDAAAEAKEREEAKAAAEAKAAEKEEKKKQAEQSKEEKAEQAQAEKERKAALKAEKAAAKAAEKEEKKRLKAEAAAEEEVVGRVNPVGATIVMVFFGLICVAVILGSQLLSKSSSVSRAETDFGTGDYENAYKSVAGLDVSESAEKTVEKVRLCMKLQKQLDSYANYYKMKLYLEALDALMRGMRNYDANRSKADEYGIITQYNELKDKIAGTLSDEFNVSEEQARSILGTEDQIDYTAKLEKIIADWEKKMREDEK